MAAVVPSDRSNREEARSQGQVKICVKVLRRGDEDSAISHMDEVSSSEDEGNENDDNDDKDDKDDRAKKQTGKEVVLSLFDAKRNGYPRGRRRNRDLGDQSERVHRERFTKNGLAKSRRRGD